MADLSFERELHGRRGHRLHAALETVDAVLWTLDADGNVVDDQPDWSRFTGQTRDEYYGRGWLDAIHPDDRQATLDGWTRVITDERMFVFVHRIRRPDGGWRRCSVKAVPQFGDDRVLIGWTGIHLDITGRLSDTVDPAGATRAVDLPAPEYSAVLDQLAEGVIVTDALGQITFLNEAAVRLHGVKQLDVNPDDYTQTYHLFTTDGIPYPPHELPLTRAVLEGETVIDARWLIRRPDGTEVLAIGTAKPIFDADGNHLGAVLTIRDDTGRHAAEEQLERLNETLESRVDEAIGEREVAEAALRQAQKMEAVGQLTGGIAHDFNNLLTIVLGSVDLLQHQLAGAIDERAARNLANIASAAGRAAALTQRLLAFARRQPLDPRATDLAALIGGMEDLINRTIGESIAFEARLSSGLGKVLVDAHQLENVLLNLAVNARDAMPGGGRLAFETARIRVEDSEFDDLAAGDFAVIRATDTGTGMSEEVRAHAYEPFFTTKESGKGTGLGLSMVYGFVKQSGGHIEIESAPGEGTTISLLLPIEDAGAGAG